MKKALLNLLVSGLLVMVILTACGGGGGGAGTNAAGAALTTIAVTPANPSIAKNTTRQCTATGTYSDGTSQDITASATWSSDSTAVATVNAAGLASGVAAGTAKITAASGAVSGATTLTVTTAALESITVTPANPGIAVGLTRQLTATGAYSDGTSQDITASVAWTSAATAVVTVDANGLATGIASGAAAITASSGTISGSTTATVGPLQSITVTPANPSVAKGLTRQFTATGNLAGGASQDITASATWSSGTTSVATVNAAGLASGVAAGSTTITASSGVISGSTTLSVTAETLQSIAVTPAAQSLGTGMAQQFTVIGTFSDGSTQNLTASVTSWNSNAPTVASMNASGLATSASPGTTTITAAVGAVSGTTSLTVTAKTLQSIAVTPANVSINTSATRQFTAIGTYSDQTTQDITSSVTWTSETPAVAAVNSAGLASGLTAGNGVAITATSGSVSGKSRMCVTLPAKELTGITLPASSNLPVGATWPIDADGLFANGTGQHPYTYVSWTSSNPAVATVDQGMVTGKTVGTTTLTVTSGSLTATGQVNVIAPVLQTIVVTPASPSFGQGSTLQLTATGTYSNGLSKNITSSVFWSSNAPATASVNSSSGLATGVAAGSATITATLGVSGNTAVTVTATAPPQTTVTLLPTADNTIKIGYSLDTLDDTVYPSNPLAVGCIWNAVPAGIYSPPFQDFVCYGSLVQFNLSSLAGKTIISAALQLQTSSYGVGYNPRQWNVHALSSSWSGNTVTWNIASNLMYYTYSYTTLNPPTYSNQLFTVDETNTVRNWVSGAYLNNGFEFGQSDLSFPNPHAVSIDAFEFFSKEDSGGRGPKLIVTYQ